VSPFGQYLGPERRGEDLTPAELEEAERMHRLRNRLGWTLLSLVAILAVLSILNTVVSAHRAQTQAFSNRELAFTACVESGNPLRQGLSDYVDSQITQTRRSDPALFPDIPPKVFARLVRKQITRLQSLRDENFAPVNCLNLYPPLDGQSYPQALVERAQNQLRP
jgi:hypothetical protein